MDKVILKPGKEKAIKNHHHWIFSGAIAHLPQFENGHFLSVYSSKDEFLGSAYFNRKSDIIGRMVSFDATPPLEMIEKRLNEAIGLRKSLFDEKTTNSYRLVNAEGDYLPGLVIDKYDSTLVLQISTLGMEKLRPWLVDYLIKTLHPTTLFEKSEQPARKEEGLSPTTTLLYGKPQEEITILENNLQFIASITEGQKTGFFLDHRNMRARVQELATKRDVLNCFSYTGAFSVYAAAGKASSVTSVDISKPSIEMAKRNMALNNFHERLHFYTEDVFKFLRENPLNYSLVILDPPAFAKRKKDVIPACRGYKDINRLTIQKMPPHSLLLTCSCSYFVDTTLFQKVIFQASVEAKRNVRILEHHHMAQDHPINICHPEGDYLKSLLVYIE